ncbi:MAG: hypothetical protein LH654_11205 [Thermoleophilia bacterium]|nr:hypothetical protein [Thermoleophilia bacterium]
MKITEIETLPVSVGPGYEDPIRPLNPSSLRLVRDKVNLPLATGEQLAHK